VARLTEQLRPAIVLAAAGSDDWVLCQLESLTPEEKWRLIDELWNFGSNRRHARQQTNPYRSLKSIIEGSALSIDDFR
jgi:hypothetical protein